MPNLDPRELYELEPDLPDLTGTVLVQALEGFVDAGSAVSIAKTHLLSTMDTQLVARFDVDQLYDYRARRPLMVFASDHWESYDDPELAVHLLHDDGGTPFLVLAGPEPDVQWERFVAAVQLLVAELGVTLTVGLSAFPMSVPHTRPAGVILHGSRPELMEGFTPWLGQVVVPASAGHLLEFRFGEAGVDALGLGVTVPPYVAQTAYPQAAIALLREVSVRTGLLLSLTPLEESAAETRVSIDEQVARSEEVQAVVRALEEQYDSYVRDNHTDTGTPLTPDGGLPSADELGAELERFLAQQSKGDGS